MKTTGAELRSEAAIYAEGSLYSTDYLVSEYKSFCANQEPDVEIDDFQRWIEAEVRRGALGISLS